MTESTKALTVRDRLTAIREYQPQPQHAQHATFTIESRPLNHPSNTVICPVCQQRLLPNEVQYHPHNTNYTPAYYVRSTLANRYHVYLNDPTQTVIAIVEYNPISHLYESVYAHDTLQYTHTNKSLYSAFRQIETDSLETGQNLKIGLDWS